MRNILLILALAAGLLAATYGATYVPGFSWHIQYAYMLGFLLLLTIITHQINSLAVSRQGRAVIVPYLTAIVLKLLLSSMFLLAIVWLHRALAKELVFLFLIYYAAFSALEIFLVNKRVRG